MSGSDLTEDDGLLAGIIADEERLGRRDLLRLFAWGFCAVLAIGGAATWHQIPRYLQRSGETAQLLAARAEHAEQLAAENGLEARRLAAAVATLNSDRDRLFNRLASLETSLESATGSLRKMEASLATPAPQDVHAQAATIGAPETVSAAASPRADTVQSGPEAAEPPVETTAALAPPAAAASPSAIQALPIPDARFDTDGQTETVAAQTEFGLELGKANSLEGLRAIWRSLARKHKSSLQGIGPIAVMRERRGGFDLYLVAGPIRDAATAARLCASLIDAGRSCRTTVFDGQRLSMTSEAVPDKARRGRRKSTQAVAPATPARRPSSSIASMIGLQ